MNTERVPDQLKITDIGGAFLLKAPNGKELYITEQTVLKMAAMIHQRELEQESQS
jgi:hypothetical protein